MYLYTVLKYNFELLISEYFNFMLYFYKYCDFNTIFNM